VILTLRKAIVETRPPHETTGRKAMRVLMRKGTGHTSCIIALWMDTPDAKKIAMPGGETLSSLHLTLAFLGKAAERTDDRAALETVCETFANRYAPISGKISGVGTFFDADGAAFYASYDAPGLNRFRENLMDALASVGIDVGREHGFTPHITLAYLKGHERPEFAWESPHDEVTFKRLTLAWGDEKTHYRLTGDEMCKAIDRRGGAQNISLNFDEPDFDESKHPRHPSGTGEGGQFAPKFEAPQGEAATETPKPEPEPIAYTPIESEPVATGPQPGDTLPDADGNPARVAHVTDDGEVVLHTPKPDGGVKVSFVPPMTPETEPEAAPPSEPTKSPHEMTPDEYRESVMEHARQLPGEYGVTMRTPDAKNHIPSMEQQIRNGVDRNHDRLIRQALKEGKSVPVANRPPAFRTLTEHLTHRQEAMREAGNPQADSPEMRRADIADHRQAVQFALEDHEPIPADVLKDYPDLAEAQVRKDYQDAQDVYRKHMDTAQDFANRISAAESLGKKWKGKIDVPMALQVAGFPAKVSSLHEANALHDLFIGAGEHRGSDVSPVQRATKKLGEAERALQESRRNQHVAVGSNITIDKIMDPGHPGQAMPSRRSDTLKVVETDGVHAVARDEAGNHFVINKSDMLPDGTLSDRGISDYQNQSSNMARMAKPEPAKSAGHLGFAHGFEYVEMPDGTIGRAPAGNPIGTEGGRRQGLRFEATKASAPQLLKMLGFEKGLTRKVVRLHFCKGTATEPRVPKGGPHGGEWTATFQAPAGKPAKSEAVKSAKPESPQVHPTLKLPKSTASDIAAAKERGVTLPPTSYGVKIHESGRYAATWFDLKGKQQYAYSAEGAADRDAHKFGALDSFASVLPAIREKVASDLKLSDAQKARVLAAVVRLIDETTMRVGGEEFAQENETFGASSLRKRHVEVAGNSVTVSFAGKHHQEWSRTIDDAPLAGAMKHLLSLPGERMFQYLSGPNKTLDVTETTVRDYLKPFGVVPKQFRTYHASRLCAEFLREYGQPSDEKQANRNIAEAVKKTAEILGNTAAVCGSSYVNPAILNAYRQNLLPAQLGFDMKGLSSPEREDWFSRVIAHVKKLLADHKIKDEPKPNTLRIKVRKGIAYNPTTGVSRGKSSYELHGIVRPEHINTATAPTRSALGTIGGIKGGMTHASLSGGKVLHARHEYTSANPEASANKIVSTLSATHHVAARPNSTGGFSVTAQPKFAAATHHITVSAPKAPNVTSVPKSAPDVTKPPKSNITAPKTGMGAKIGAAASSVVGKLRFNTRPSPAPVASKLIGDAGRLGIQHAGEDVRRNVTGQTFTHKMPNIAAQALREHMTNQGHSVSSIHQSRTMVQGKVRHTYSFSARDSSGANHHVTVHRPVEANEKSALGRFKKTEKVNAPAAP